MSKRPEHQAPPEMFYDDTEAEKYTKNSRIIEIQAAMTERALEILQLPPDEPAFLLDLGCGSGISGDVITSQGHFWAGLDVSPSMLNIAREGDTPDEPREVMLGDMGQGIPFRAGTFDGVVSISALQWLCNADKKWHHPPKRLLKFFTQLYSAMKPGARAVFQLYPETPQQMELITKQATRAGFAGGVLVDYPNSSKAKKYFLCLDCGGGRKMPAAKGVHGDQQHGGVENSGRRRFGKKSVKSNKEKINEIKERHRRKGMEVRENTKFTGRKRRHKF